MIILWLLAGAFVLAATLVFAAFVRYLLNQWTILERPHQCDACHCMHTRKDQHDLHVAAQHEMRFWRQWTHDEPSRLARLYLRPDPN
jgi:hypothetical protein